MEKKLQKTFHIIGTFWFMACVVYLLVVSLRRAQVNWWIIFSLSGPSLAVGMLLVSVYLFAVYRSAGRSQTIEVEHPLTALPIYMIFYHSAPFWGIPAGIAGMIGETGWSPYVLGVTYGTLTMTFLVWIILDPLTGLVETILPASRRHRNERIARWRDVQQELQRDREQLLAGLEVKEKLEAQRHKDILQPMAEELAHLLPRNVFSDQPPPQIVLQMGLKAWQMGGLSGMRELHQATLARYHQLGGDSPPLDYLSWWWDGVGQWRY